MSTNSVAIVSEYYAGANTSPTLIRLPENFRQVKRSLDSFTPQFRFKGKFDTRLPDRGQLEEIPSDDELLKYLVTNLGRLFEQTWMPPKGFGLPLNLLPTCAILSKRSPSTIDTA